MSESTDRPLPPDTEWTCFLCHQANVGGHICKLCHRPGRALPSTNRPTAEEMPDCPACTGRHYFDSFDHMGSSTWARCPRCTADHLTPSKQHAPTPAAEEVNAMRERLHAATMKAQAHSQEGMITATPTTAAVGTCNACEYPDSPENVVEVTLHVGNGLTFRLCRQHSRELTRKLREALQ